MASRSTPAKKGPSPAAAKTERLLNLVIALLSTRQPLSRARIRQAVPDYAAGSDEAFERMFERDKDELRALGIPLRTEPIDPFFDDEPGYRIDQREYALPQTWVSLRRGTPGRCKSRTQVTCVRGDRIP